MTSTLDAPSVASKGIKPVSMSRYDTDFQGFSDDLGASFTRYGFAVVSDHGLDEQVILAAIDDAKAFFALPEAVKRQYHQPGTGGARGLTPFGVEAAKGAAAVDLKEFWHVGRELPEGHPYRQYMRDNLWPSEVPGFKPHFYGMFEALDALGARILRAIARYLKLDDGYFEDKVQLGNSILRMLHYPPVSAGAPGVTWTAPHAAAALNWGTLFRFSFIVSQAPVKSTVALRVGAGGDPKLLKAGNLLAPGTRRLN